MKKPYPSLSASGWRYSVAEVADYLMANFIANEENQTTIYKGTVTSLIFLIQEYGNDMTDLESHVKKSLTNYYSRYFELVDVSVDTSKADPEDPNRVNLSVNVDVARDGIKYNVGKEIRTLNSKVIEVFDLVKEGN